MAFSTISDAIAHVLETEEIYALEEREIRGVDYRTFKNGPKTLRDLLGYCERQSELDFLVYRDERYSFGAVHDHVLRLARALTEDFGVKPGDHVALLMRNLPEYPMLFLALGSIGAVTVFINSWWTSQELEYGFHDSGARLVFVDESRFKRMEPFAERMGIERVMVRNRAAEKQPAFWDILDAELPHKLPDVDIDPDNDLAVMYTSGSSGHPKGVVMTHRGALNTVQTWLFNLHVSSLLGKAPRAATDGDGNPIQSAIMLTTPFFHVSGTHSGVLLGIWIASKLIILHKWDPNKAVRLVKDEQVTRFAGVPTMCVELVEAAREAGSTLDTLVTIDSGGAKRPAGQVKMLAEAVPGAMIGNGYGLTESNGLGVAIRGQDYLDQPDATGRLHEPVQDMRIVDENDNDLPPGMVGELLLKSPSNMRCYLNDPEMTAKTLRDGWLHTGDLARVDDHGVITLVDRKKDLIIRGGENISCNEVNSALDHHPAVIESVVFSIPDERLGEAVGACVQLRPGESVSEDELKEFVGSHLAAYKVPTTFWFRASPLPRGATEKIDRRRVREECIAPLIAS